MRGDPEPRCFLFSHHVQQMYSWDFSLNLNYFRSHMTKTLNRFWRRKKILKFGPLPDDDAFEDICSTLLKLLLCGLYEWSLCKEWCKIWQNRVIYQFSPGALAQPANLGPKVVQHFKFILFPWVYSYKLNLSLCAMHCKGVPTVKVS